MANKNSTFTARLSDSTLDAIASRAASRKQSKAAALEGLVDEALDTRGRDGLELRIAALEATVAEQEKLLRGQGKQTPRTKRVSVGLTLAEAAALEKAARTAGMSRADFIRDMLIDRRGAVRAHPALPSAIDMPPNAPPTPALPNGGGQRRTRQTRRR